jgi:hypothetical protein
MQVKGLRPSTTSTGYHPVQDVREEMAVKWLSSRGWDRTLSAQLIDHPRPAARDAPHSTEQPSPASDRPQ